MTLYETKRYSVHLYTGGLFEVRNLWGKTVSTCHHFKDACQLADLYQGDDDAEYERERWEAERGLEP